MRPGVKKEQDFGENNIGGVDRLGKRLTDYLNGKIYDEEG